jgi:integral membrane protein (TIGR01906 family)
MQKGHVLLITAFSVALFLIIIFGSINIVIFDVGSYTSEYSKNGVYPKLSDNTTQAVAMAGDITKNIMDYFRGRAELQYFTEDEKSHMSDVRHLLDLMRIIYYSAIAVSIALFIYLYITLKNDSGVFIRILAKSLLYSSIACIAFLAIVLIMCVFYFDATFTLFHLIFFPQGNWMFASSSLLITLFPEQFFMDMSLRIFIYAMFQSIIFFGIGFWINRQMKEIGRHHQ